MGADILRLLESAGVVDRGPERERDQGTDARHGHEPAAHVIGLRQGQHLALTARQPAGQEPAG